MRRALRVRGGELSLHAARFRPAGLVVGDLTLLWDHVGGGLLHGAESWPGAPAAGWSVNLVVHGTWFQSASLIIGRYTGAAPHYDEAAEGIRLALVSSVFAMPSLFRRTPSRRSCATSRAPARRSPTPRASPRWTPGSTGCGCSAPGCRASR